MCDLVICLPNLMTCFQRLSSFLTKLGKIGVSQYAKTLLILALTSSNGTNREGLIILKRALSILTYLIVTSLFSEIMMPNMVKTCN